jgi:plastocyanin
MRAATNAGIAAAAALALAASGCSVKNNDADVVTGKKLFVQKCGSCHTLARAGTKGTTGPNLDQAFQQSLKEGFGINAVRGVVHKQILYPSRSGLYGTGIMPAKLITGKQAEDVAAYVAAVVARPGKDAGLLATAVQPAGSNKPAIEKAGVLTIPADPSGQLLFVNKTAEAKPGNVTIKMPNQSGVQHNIAIPGKGAGKIVSKGVSEFTATLAAGKYTYLCEVPGHAAAGMKGTLTVK